MSTTDLAPPPELCDCCAAPGHAELCCTTFFLPCVTFGRVVEKLPDYKGTKYACQLGTGMYGLLWYFPTFLSCCGAASTGASSTVSLLAGLLAGFANDKALQLEGGKKENPCCGCIPCWVAKGVFCSPCALCQASNRLARLEQVKAGSSSKNTSFVAPRAKMMAL